MNSTQKDQCEEQIADEELLRQIEAPLIILSSQAGGGNHSVASALRKRLVHAHPQTLHLHIEDLVADRLVRSDFVRHHWICRRAPALLKLTYGLPFSYRLKLLRGKLFDNKNLSLLKSEIDSTGARTVITTNHRAAFWISSLKHRQQLQCQLWGVITDYSLSPGWKYLFADQLDVLLGPLSIEQIPLSLRSAYRRIPFPVQSEYRQLRNTPGSKKHVLITGGAWGLGPLERTISVLRGLCPELSLHVVCGTNQSLFHRLQAKYRNCQDVSLHQHLPTLVPLMEKCKAVITRPGAVTITETHQAGRMIFLLKGLPVIEAENSRYAIENFSALRFTPQAFVDWYRQC